MKKFSVGLAATLLILTACGPSHRVTYSGREESTEGVPGFVNGKKVSPNVKLGQSYRVDGEEYVPRYEPDYVEEGKASWYGPGFHGGKTANGEEFDKNDMTAAHRTLPLPSIVRVTMLSNGKQVFVRVNDRGPFARGRIIDLSRAAAEKIDLVGVGVAKVRVEYMPAESQRFADLLATGREPKSIDIASEVLFKGETTKYADRNAGKRDSMWEKMNPVSNADAAEPEVNTVEAAPVATIAANELPPADLPAKAAVAKIAAKPAAAKPVVAAKQAASPFAVMNETQVASAAPEEIDHNADGWSEIDEPVQAAPVIQAAAPMVQPAPPAVALKPIIVPKPNAQMAQAAPAQVVAAPAAMPTGKMFVQLGAFLQQANAQRLAKKYPGLGNLNITPKRASDGATLYHVRMGPFANVADAQAALARANAMQVDGKIVSE